MSIRALIVDDETLARELIRELLAGEEDIEIVGEATDGRRALSLIRSKRPELVFLDIQMPRPSGIEVLEQLQPADIPYVIFITAYSRFAIRAFELHALDYLLKPIGEDRFREAIERARSVIRRHGLEQVVKKMMAAVQLLSGADTEMRDDVPTPAGRFLREIRTKEGHRVLAIPVESIMCLCAANQYAQIVSTRGSHLMSSSLSALERKLDPAAFVRIHRSTIVHTAFVRDVITNQKGSYSVVMTDGKRYPISRNRRHSIPALLKR